MLRVALRRRPGPNSSLRGRTVRRVSLVTAALLAFFCGGRDAAAQVTLYHPGQHPSYVLELEPHFAAGLFPPPGDGDGAGIGGGVRATFEVLHQGFIPTINNSIAIGAGADLLHYQGPVIAPGACTRFVTLPSGTAVCVQVAQKGGSSNYAFFPVVMQWNFWLTRQWSVFGEPGLAIYWFDFRSPGVVPVIYLGGRFHLSDRVALTLRIGYPTFSAGASFFF